MESFKPCDHACVYSISAQTSDQRIGPETIVSINFQRMVSLLLISRSQPIKVVTQRRRCYDVSQHAGS